MTTERYQVEACLMTNKLQELREEYAREAPRVGRILILAQDLVALSNLMQEAIARDHGEEATNG